MNQKGKDSNRYEILVVDDKEDVLITLRDILQGDDYIVTCKGSGKEGFEAGKSGNFDLIILDVVMPGMDGFEVCRKLKKDSKTSDIPIIFVTIKDEPEYLKEGLKLGAADFIIKPFDRSEILARIRPHVKLYRIKKILLKDCSNDAARKILDMFDDLAGNR